MCDNWKNKKFNEYSCEGVVLDEGEGEYIVKGNLETANKDATILYFAPNPPTYSQSYTGSGLPYPNPNIAFDNTPNRGAVKLVNGEFKFRVRYPNSYYVGLGTVYVEPHVYLKVCNDGKIHTVKLGNGIPFRFLTYPPAPNTAPRENPMFYQGAGRDILPPRTQEQILRDSAYPSENVMPKNFWGKAVPHP